ncbi:MAG: protein kinase [Syntrophaceae bacterium]
MPEFQPIRFGKYLLIDQLAKGGMAQLFRAKIIGIEGFEKLIAIKMILPQLAKEQDLVSSFIDEAKLAALLNHQNIVQIYDFGSMGDSYFISMEYLLGNDLRAISNKAKEKNMPLSLEYALYIVSRVCSGLAYAHELKDFQGKSLNIIHRDISPQNIFVTYQGDVKILDFGIAKAASRSTATQFGMIKGKVAYMSPEQATGKQVDKRSDIFSTGILLYELITNSKMFTGTNTVEILTKVRDVEYRSPQSISGGLHPKVYGILDRALAKKPERRYQSCNEMLADLEECIVALGLRPSSWGLAQYMQALFANEIAAGGQVVREISDSREVEEAETERTQEAPLEEPKAPLEKPKLPLKEPIAPLEIPKVPLEEPIAALKEPIVSLKKSTATSEPEQHLQWESLEKAKEIAQEKPHDKPKKKTWPLYAAFAAVIVIVILAAVFWPKGEPVTSQVKDTTVATVQSTEVKSSEGTATVASSESQKTQESLAKAKELQEQALQLVDKEPQKALPLLLEALKLDPGSVQSYFQLGRTYMKLKDYSKAIESYEKAAELDPKLSDIYFNLGFAYAMNKNYVKAEEMYGRVVNMGSQYPDEALFNLAVIQEKQGKIEECISTLERARSINPNNDVVKKHLDRMKGKVKKRK